MILLGLVLFFALVGAMTGAARQLAHMVALVAAWVLAGPLGKELGPHLARSLEVPALLGMLAATVLLFFALLVSVRVLLGWALRSLLGAEDPESRWVDRTLGLVLGGTKAALLIWAVLSGLTLVEEHVAIQGRRPTLSTRDSVAFSLARQLNLFELMGLAPEPLKPTRPPPPASPASPARRPRPR
jgi:membrane protein required for colicin V production